MKYKILAIIALVISFTSASYVLARGQDDSSKSSINVNIQGSAQVSDEDEDIETEIKDDENIEIEDDDTNEASLGVELKTKIQKESQDKNKDDIKDQENDQDESDDVKDNDSDGDDENDNDNEKNNAIERRSQVANAVQEILKIADKHKGIGEQVRVIARAQNQNQEDIEISLEKVQMRNSFIKFLLGPKYNEIKKAEKILEQNREQIALLNQVKSEVKVSGDLKVLTDQITLLEKINLEIETKLDTYQKGFSLLGWLFK
ncbi:MAG: hypothetical protein WC758_08695 [Candidatus Woesearchaeota archaeon]|jgi:hypothetical protein